MPRSLLAVVFGLLSALSLAPASVHARTVKVKVATVAPKGTSFHRILTGLADEWTQISDGAVKLKIYPGGVAGDETEVVRKIRLGTLHGGLVTSNGLADIDRVVNALQIPMAYDDFGALDYVRGKMEPAMDTVYADKGFVVLGWTEAGWVRFLSKSPIVQPADAHALKMFVNAGNPEQVEVWRSGGFKPEPLPVTEITTALQTGLIEAVPTTAQGALMLRWYEHAGHMTDHPWSPLVGALIVDAKVWEKIDPALRPKLRAAARKACDALRADIRKTDAKAADEMAARGLKVTRIDAGQLAVWKRMVDDMRGALRGPYVPPAAWDEAQTHLKAYRGMKGFTDGADE